MPTSLHSLRLATHLVVLRRLEQALRDATPRLQRWRAAARQRRQARDTRTSLGALDDRTLHDLGFHRCEIESIAANPTDPHRARVLRSVFGPSKSRSSCSQPTQRKTT